MNHSQTFNNLAVYQLQDALLKGIATSVAADNCTSSPCQHGGTCINDGSNSLICYCEPGYTDLFCSTSKLPLCIFPWDITL